MCMVMRARVMGLACGRRELLVSAAFTALLVASILLLLTGTGPKTMRARVARRAQPARPGRAPARLVYKPPSSSTAGHGGARRAPRLAMAVRASSATGHGGARRAPRPAMVARVELRGRPWWRASSSAAGHGGARRALPLPLRAVRKREKGETEEEDD
jgi:hypothetical protein